MKRAARRSVLLGLVVSTVLVPNQAWAQRIEDRFEQHEVPADARLLASQRFAQRSCTSSRVIGTSVGIVFGAILGGLAGEGAAKLFNWDQNMGNAIYGAVIGAVAGGIIGAVSACPSTKDGSKSITAPDDSTRRR